MAGQSERDKHRVYETLPWQLLPPLMMTHIGSITFSTLILHICLLNCSDGAYYKHPLVQLQRNTLLQISKRKEWKRKKIPNKVKECPSFVVPDLNADIIKMTPLQKRGFLPLQKGGHISSDNKVWLNHGTG